MAIILNIETSTKNCSVSISKDGNCISLFESKTKNYSHSENLHVFIKKSLKDARIKFSNLNAVCVSRGPGSYTGLRIGVASAKGICYVLNIPLLSIDTLTVISKEMNPDEGFLIPMIDANRKEVYTTVFDSFGKMLCPIEAIILNNNSYQKYSNKKIHLIGDGAFKALNVLKLDFEYHPNIIPSAKKMGEISEKLFKQKKNENILFFEPFYFK